MVDYLIAENIGGWWVRHKSGDNVIKTANHEIAEDLVYTLNFGALGRRVKERKLVAKEPKRAKEEE